MKNMIISGGLAVVLAATAAIAAPGDRAARIDTNGDGVSVAEMRQHLAQRFQRLDANKDGQLTQAELGASREKRAERRADRRGGRGDGARMFERMDADKDGQVSRAEFDAQRAQRRDGRRGGGERMFTHADADRNGVVTLAEFTSRADERVARLDLNRDGKVSGEEFGAGRGGKGRQRQAD